ncbi:DNA-binding response regulator [Amycolatopsis sp. WAC 04169]|nr:DNA-binding response regulator [Amycolatopsis sp. WAC 04169]
MSRRISRCLLDCALRLIRIRRSMNENNSPSLPPVRVRSYFEPPLQQAGRDPEVPREARFRAVVVDPHPRRRRAYAGRLRRMGAERVVEGSTPRGFRAGKTAASRTHVAVLYAGGDARAMVDQVGDLYRRGAERVVVVAGSRDPGLAVAALRADAVGYLADSPDSATRIAARKSPSEDERRVVAEYAVRKAVLSEREIEILCLVADGRTNQEIGTELLVSPNTVKGHLAHMARKLQTGDRTRMVLLALRAGVIS